MQLEGAGRFLRVLIDFAERCNLECIMCHFSLPGHNVRSNEISFTEFERLAPQMLPHANHLGLSCATEPLVFRDFLRVLPIVKRFDVPFVYYITNAMLLTEEVARETIRSEVDMVTISFDGACKETFEAIRRKAVFEKVVANVRRLRDLKREMGSERPRLQFCTTLMRTNIEEVEELLGIFAELGGEEVDFRHVVPYEGLESCELSLFEHKELTNRHLDRARGLAADLGLQLVNCPANFDLSPPAEPAAAPAPASETDAAPASHLRRMCDSPWTMILIHPDGGVVPCSNWYTHELMGNVREQSFEEIWNGPKYRELREGLLTGNLSENCSRCPALGCGSVDREESFEARKI